MFDILPQSTGNILAIRVSQGFDIENDLPVLYEGLAKATEADGKYRLVLDFGQLITGMNLQEATEIARFVIEQEGQLQKVALVGKPSWAGSFAQYLEMATGVDIKSFRHDDLDKAMAWISS